MLRSSALLNASLLALAVAGNAQTSEPGALDNARVLESVEVDFGDHSVFYNRVAAPKLKPETQRPVPPPYVPTAAEIEEANRIDSLRYVNLWLSCTVFDGVFTEVRFWQDGQEVVVQSSIDFNLLAHGFDLETEDSYYSLYLGLGDVPRDEFEGTWPVALLAEAAKAGRSKWQLVSNAPLSADSVRTLEDLHRYFDTHREKLVAQRAEREAAQRAHEEWLKANPPVPEDIVVNYFPIRSAETKGSK